MGTPLTTYLGKRIDLQHPQPTFNPDTKPVLTISRSFGCPAQEITKELVRTLNFLRKSEYLPKWEWVGKEVIEETAKTLNVNPQMVEKILTQKESSVFDDMFLSLSNKDYPGDFKIKKTIGTALLNHANQGHTVILGRGAVALCQVFKNAAHIQLQAPLEWRITQLSNQFNIGHDETMRRIEKTEKDRDQLRKFFAGAKNPNDLYDMSLNCARLSLDEIVTAIIGLMRTKGLI